MGVWRTCIHKPKIERKIARKVLLCCIEEHFTVTIQLVITSKPCVAKVVSHFFCLMPGLHFRLGYSSRLLARCERDEVRTNVDIHTLVRESSIMRQDIQDILVSFDSGLIYPHVSESFKMRREQVESVEDNMNVPFTFSHSRLVSCRLDENVNQALERRQVQSFNNSQIYIRMTF